jgi:hypothetical protein
VTSRRLLLLVVAVLALVGVGCNTVVFQGKGVPPSERDDQAEDTETKAASKETGTSDDEKEITDVFVWFFDGSDLLADGVATQEEVDVKAAKVYNVDNIKDTLSSVMQANSDVFAQLSAEVSKIDFAEDANRATVTFTLFVNGEPTLVDASGDAVKDGDEWKIDAQLTCDLVALADASAPCDPGPPPGV